MGTEHLGGAWPDDPAGWYPELWAWLVTTVGVRSVIDVGCGEARALREFGRLGCLVRGVDGIAGREFVDEHDYTTGPWVPDRRYDLAWSCEFVEHVEPSYIGNFFATFEAAELLLMTHATPGQGGHHHVNCQPSSYWIERLEARGFEYDPWLTIACRELARHNPEPRNYFSRTGLALRRTT